MKRRVLYLVSIALLAPLHYPPSTASARSSVSLELAITPLQCYIERVNDGLREVVRIMPQECQQAVRL